MQYKLLRTIMKHEDIELQRRFGETYYEAGIVKLAIDSLISLRDESESIEAIKLLNEIYKDPTANFRLKLLDFISSTELYYSLFIFILNELESSKNRILMKHRVD